jgi:hypothetical protein
VKERTVELKLDHTTKTLLCRLLCQHVQALKAYGSRRGFTSHHASYEADRTQDLLDQILEQWTQALPSLPNQSGRVS